MPNVIRHDDEAEPRTALQIAIHEQLHLPQKPGESQWRRCKRIAAKVGCRPEYVQNILHIQKCREIGRQKREAESAKLLPVLSDGESKWGTMELDVVRGFRGWRDAFGKLKIVIGAYRYLAQSRGDVFADSFLGCMLDICEKADLRASREPIR